MTEAEECLLLPSSINGTIYEMTNLVDDQKQIATLVVEKINEWMTCSDPSKFKPLQLIIQGAAKTGKTYLLNVLMETLREAFAMNDVMHIVTENAEHLNKTYEQFTGIPVYEMMDKRFEMTSMQKKWFMKRCEHLLCLAFDNGAMINTRLMGTIAKILEKSAYNGCSTPDTFGNIPVVLLTNDVGMITTDFESLWYSIQNNYKGKGMTVQGRHAFQQLSSNVMFLYGKMTSQNTNSVLVSNLQKI